LTIDNKIVHNDIMIRTQVSLSQEEYTLAQSESKKLGISLAEFFRRALRPTLPIDSSKPWMRFIGFIESGDSQSSQNIDSLVYGFKN